VQATSAGGIGLLALIARRHGAILTRRDRTAVGLATAGLVLLAISLAGGTGAGLHARPSALVGWLAVSVLAASVPALGSLGPSLAAGAGFGIASGVLYAAGDVATKAAFAGGIWLALFAVMALAHAGAFVCLQLGFQRGGTLATAGVSTMLMNALPIAAGVVVFHEGLPDELFGSLRVIAFASVVVGAALLARDAATAAPRVA
jgi:hypothetical protein